MFLPALAVVMLLADRCLGSDNNNNNNGTATPTTAIISASELSSSSQWAEYSTQSPLTNSGGNETAVGKPSKFDEHVEDWQYVDDPLKNVTAVAEPAAVAAGNSTACKTCLIDKAKTRRNKRNHDVLLFKMAVKQSRHRDLYAQLIASVAAKQSYRRKRFRRQAPSSEAAESSTYKQLFRYKRYRRSAAVDDTSSAADADTSAADFANTDVANTAAEDTAEDFSLARSSAAKQLYRRKRFRRSAVAAYPNGVIRPYHYNNNHRAGYQQHGLSLAADLQLQQNRRRRYRYAADPYHYKRNGAATSWDRSAEFRRRYLRFPPTHDAPPPAYNNIVGGGNPWSPAAVLPGHLSQQQQQQPFSYLPQYPIQPPQSPPSMGPRSPRLVFRDPVDQGTLQAPFGGPNGLQDLLVSQPDDVKGQCQRAYIDGGSGLGGCMWGPRGSLMYVSCSYVISVFFLNNKSKRNHGR